MLSVYVCCMFSQKTFLLPRTKTAAVAPYCLNLGGGICTGSLG